MVSNIMWHPDIVLNTKCTIHFACFRDNHVNQMSLFISIDQVIRLNVSQSLWITSNNVVLVYLASSTTMQFVKQFWNL